MMNKIVNIFVFIFAAFFVVSCESSRAENGDFLFGVENPGGSSGVVKKLKSVTSDDGSGEIVIFNYIYASGKLAKVWADDQSISYDLTYDGNSINKIKIVQDNGGSITTTNFDITYKNGQFSEAKGTGSEEGGSAFTNTITANYTNKKISKLVSKMVGIDSEDPNTTYDLFTVQSDIGYTGNNVSTWKFSTSYPETTPIPPIVINTRFSEYDTKKNPFNMLPETYNIISSLFGLENTAVTGFSANNYKKVSADTESATYTYTYDADGYPTKAVGSNGLGTLTFEYQK